MNPHHIVLKAYFPKEEDAKAAFDLVFPSVTKAALVKVDEDGNEVSFRSATRRSEPGKPADHPDPSPRAEQPTPSEPDDVDPARPSSRPSADEEGTEFGDPVVRPSRTQINRHRIKASIHKPDGTQYSVCEAIMKHKDELAVGKGRTRFSLPYIVKYLHPYGYYSRSGTAAALRALANLGFVRGIGKNRSNHLVYEYQNTPKEYREFPLWARREAMGDSTIHDVIYAFARKKGEFSMAEAQAHIYELGWSPTGASPALSNLCNAGLVIRGSTNSQMFRFAGIAVRGRITYDLLSAIREGRYVR